MLVYIAGCMLEKQTPIHPSSPPNPLDHSHTCNYFRTLYKRIHVSCVCSSVLLFFYCCSFHIYIVHILAGEQIPVPFYYSPMCIGTLPDRLSRVLNGLSSQPHLKFTLYSSYIFLNSALLHHRAFYVMKTVIFSHRHFYFLILI